MRRRFCQRLVVVCNQYSWLLVEFASNKHLVIAWRRVFMCSWWCRIWPCSYSEEDKSGREILKYWSVVSVRFNLLLFTKRNNFYLPKVKFLPSLVIFFAELHIASLINQIFVVSQSLKWKILVKVKKSASFSVSFLRPIIDVSFSSHCALLPES